MKRRDLTSERVGGEVAEDVLGSRSSVLVEVEEQAKMEQEKEEGPKTPVRHVRREALYVSMISERSLRLVIRSLGAVEDLT